MIRWLPAALLLASSEPVPDIPKPPTASPPGVVRVWGNPGMLTVGHAWARAFEELHPGIRVELHLTGSDVGMAALYTGTADVALLGREATSAETKAFEWIFRYRPTAIPVSSGSEDREGQSPTLAVLVHPSNPIGSISVSQLKSVLLNERFVWGDIDRASPLAGEPVTIYMPAAESGTGSFIRSRLVGGDIRLDWDRVIEFIDPPGRQRQDTSGRRASEALAHDPAGLAFGIRGTEGTREIAVVEVKGGGGASSTTGVASRVRFERLTYAYVNKTPDVPLDSETAMFLDFVTGARGQELLARHSAYRPLRKAN